MKKITESNKDEFEFEQRLAKSILKLPEPLQRRFKILKILSVSYLTFRIKESNYPMSLKKEAESWKLSMIL